MLLLYYQELDLWVEDIDRQDGIISSNTKGMPSAGFDTSKTSRVQKTRVCNETCDPHWDMELIYPLQISSIEDVLEGKNAVFF